MSDKVGEKISVEGGSKVRFPSTIFRLELEGVKQSILHAFADHNSTVAAIVADAVERFPFEEYAKKQVEKVLPDIINETVKRMVDAHVRARLMSLQRVIEKELYGS